MRRDKAAVCSSDGYAGGALGGGGAYGSPNRWCVGLKSRAWEKGIALLAQSSSDSINTPWPPHQAGLLSPLFNLFLELRLMVNRGGGGR